MEKKIFPPDPNSHYRRIAFVEGISKERFYQLGQYIRSEDAYIYSINDTSKFIYDSGYFIRRFTISLIDTKGQIFEWYEFERGNNQSVSLQLNVKYQVV